ncbi:glycosyltransferase [Dolichospermum sp. ST_sed3]|nr:glycosyltransferase [Dolichospermum sp. ST_sed3]
MSDNIFISIIICTYRRPDSLKLNLETLIVSCEKYGYCDYEVLIIENDVQTSNEITEVVNSCQDRMPIKLYLEKNTGLSHARNCGAQEAQGEYLVYLDDDCMESEDWLTEVVNGIRKYNPDFCGGPFYPYYLVPKPYWYLDEWGSGYCLGDNDCETDVPPCGGNFVVKRKLVLDLKFSEDFGMTGGKVAYGEETDLVLRAKSANPDMSIYYLPKAFVRHEVRPVKMTLRWNIHQAFVSGRDTANTNRTATGSLLRHLKNIFLEFILILVKIPVVAGVMFLDIFRPQRSVWKRYVRGNLLKELISLIYHITMLKIIIRKTRK